MRIAQIAPLYESVPPKYYGGTERIVSYLTEELVREGHEVVLFASGDSLTSADLIATRGCSLRLDKFCMDQIAPHIRMLELVSRKAQDFDILHFHTDYLHYPVARRERFPLVTTLHGRLDVPELVPLYEEFPEMPVVSISDSQRKPLPWINWQRTVHHGLPAELYQLSERPGSYLAFLGRISPEKGVDAAIRIAARIGMEIKISAKVDERDREYFHSVIEPMLKHPLVEFVGEIGEAQKNEFLGNAHALLFPINWPEPFGLVLIEAMATGTPVIAYRNGSVPELIEHGVTGFIVESAEEAVKAVEQIPRLSRRRCRQVFEQRFSVSRMGRDYVAVYQRLLEARQCLSSAA